MPSVEKVLGAAGASRQPDGCGSCERWTRRRVLRRRIVAIGAGTLARAISAGQPRLEEG